MTRTADTALKAWRSHSYYQRARVLEDVRADIESDRLAPDEPMRERLFRLGFRAARALGHRGRSAPRYHGDLLRGERLIVRAAVDRVVSEARTEARESAARAAREYLRAIGICAMTGDERHAADEHGDCAPWCRQCRREREMRAPSIEDAAPPYVHAIEAAWEALGPAWRRPGWTLADAIRAKCSALEVISEEYCACGRRPADCDGTRRECRGRRAEQ